MDRYSARINLHGGTKRERHLNLLKQSLTKNIPNSLSSKSIKINGIEQNIEIVRTNDELIKTIHSLPDEKFSTGDYVVHGNATYLITKVDFDDEVYTIGTMEYCNWTLKFQSPDGTILSYPCIDSNPYNRGGEKEGTVITLGNTEKSITLPCDQNTILLRNKRRFFIDKHPTEPKSYEIIGVNTTSKNYGDKGLIELTVKETTMQLSAERPDRVDLGICNYFEPSTTPPLPPESEKYSIITCSNANNQITIGASARTLTPTFYKDDVEYSDVFAVWVYEFPLGFENQFTIASVSGTNKIKISVKDNTSLIGKTIIATVSDELGNYKSSITITVVSGF